MFAHCLSLDYQKYVEMNSFHHLHHFDPHGSLIEKIWNYENFMKSTWKHLKSDAQSYEKSWKWYVNVCKLCKIKNLFRVFWFWAHIVSGVLFVFLLTVLLVFLVLFVLLMFWRSPIFPVFDIFMSITVIYENVIEITKCMINTSLNSSMF